jgi:hypothetical protein
MAMQVKNEPEPFDGSKDGFFGIDEIAAFDLPAKEQPKPQPSKDNNLVLTSTCRRFAEKPEVSPSPA